MQRDFDLATAYAKGEELVSNFDKLRDIDTQISKLRMAKERAYQQFSGSIIGPLRDKGIDVDPNGVTVFYHKDPEGYRKIKNLKGVDEQFLNAIISESRIVESPVILGTARNSIFVSGEPQKKVNVLYKPSTSVYRRGKKLRDKVDNIISSVRKLREERKKICIDPKEVHCVLNNLEKEYDNLSQRNGLTTYVLRKTKEGVKVLQEIYERKKEELNFVINDLSSEGISFEFLKGCSPEEIERLSSLKPKVKKELNGKKIDGLIEMCKLMNEMEGQVKGLSQAVDLTYSDIRKAENLVQKLRQIKSEGN